MTEANSAASVPPDQSGPPDHPAARERTAPAQAGAQSNAKKARQSVGASLIYALAIAISCVALTQLVFPAHFETADDLNFSLLLSGVGLTHAPTYQTWFTNIIITYPLMWLFQWMPDIAWYSIYLFTALTAGFTLVALALILRFNLSIGTALFLIYYILIGAFIVNGLQYTSTTALLTQSAFLLAFCLPLVKRFSAGKFPKGLTCTAVMAAVFASMIRFEPFLLVLVISAMTIMAVAPGKLHFFKGNRKPLAAIAIAIICAFALKTASNYYYDSQPAFAGVRDFFKPFSDLADSDREKIAGARTQLSDNDYALVKQFFVADKNIFTTETLSNAVSASSLPFTLYKLQWTFFSSIAPVLLFCLAIAWLLDETIMSRPRLLIWLAGIVALTLYLSFFMKLPARIHLTLLTCAITTLFMFLDRRKVKRIIHSLQKGSGIKHRASVIGVSVAAGFLAYSTAGLLYEDHQHVYEEGLQIKTAIKRLAPKPNQLYIVLGTTTPYQFMRPFENLRLYFDGFDIYRTSLWSRMPVGDRMLNSHGFKNLLDACKSPDVLFISNADGNDRFAQFCKEHYQMDAKFKRVFNDANLSLNVYSLALDPTGD